MRRVDAGAGYRRDEGPGRDGQQVDLAQFHTGAQRGWVIRRLAQPLPNVAVNFGSRDRGAPPTQLRNLLNLLRRGRAVQQFQG